MEPATILGLASSGAQLAQLTLDICVRLCVYYRDAKRASVQSKNLREELLSAVDLLMDTQATLEKARGKKMWQSVEKELETIRRLVRELDERIRPDQTSGIRQLRWPFAQEENARYINQIQNFRTTLTAKLSLRQLYLIFISPF